MTDELKRELGLLAQEIFDTNRKNGFHPIDPTTATTALKIALIAGEAHEMLSALQKTPAKEPIVSDALLEEAADVFIRLLDLVEMLDTTADFVDMIRTKLDRNKTRGYRHGGKRF